MSGYMGTVVCSLLLLLVLSPAIGNEMTPEVVTVDLSMDQGPAVHPASGFLHAMSRTTPDPSMVDPLKPSMFRMRAHWSEGEAGAFGNYERVKKLGAKLQLVVSDDTGYGRRGWLPGDNGDWKQWEDVVEGLVKEAAEKGCKFQWDIWNEPNIPTFWNSDRDRFFETWHRGFIKIRSLDPKTEIVGPSLARFDSKWLETFLLYAKKNRVLPDILSWHEMGREKSGASDIPAHVDYMRQFMANNGINIKRFSINEMIGPHIQTKPGTAAWFFYGIERCGVESAAHACWGDEDPKINNCQNCSLDGILTHNERKPRSSWWAYKGYADVTGRLVKVEPSASVTGVAGTDPDARAVRMILGRDGSADGSVAIVIKGLDRISWLTVNGKVRIVVQKIPHTGWQHLPSPVTVIDSERSAFGDELQITIPDFARDDAYIVGLSPISLK